MNFKIATVILLVLIITLSIILIIQRNQIYKIGNFEIKKSDFNNLMEASGGEQGRIFDIDNNQYINVKVAK